MPVLVPLLWLLHWLPLPLLSRVGSGLGRLLFALARARRRIALRNLELCFPALSSGARHELAREHFKVLARSFLERGILWWGSAARVRRMVRVEGLEHLPEDKPSILLVPHFVGLDAAWTRLTLERDMAGIYANQKNPFFNRVLYRARIRFGHQIALSRQEGVREGVRAIKAGRPFYYLPDMDYGARDSVFVPFFGVPAATITGLSRLARLTGAVVIPCIARMLPGGAGYVITLEEAWRDFPGDDVTADTLRMNAYIEARVREMPEQYYWVHKRFKTRPAGEASLY
ncbi:MAG: lipid A biosynthesis acyltransferase [Pseudomonadota bacterium]|jgi:KDO2-lipid IV(A) lauroyltransferase